MNFSTHLNTLFGCSMATKPELLTVVGHWRNGRYKRSNDGLEFARVYKLQEKVKNQKFKIKQVKHNYKFDGQ